MARKATKVPDQGMLMVLEAEEAPQQVSPVPSPRAKEQPPKAASIEVAHEMETASEPAVMAFCSLGVKDGYWTVAGMIHGDGGEVLAVLEGKGVVTADGVQHSGWILAAIDAMQRVQAHGPVDVFEIRIPDHFPVGFLRVTLPARAKAAVWDEEMKKYPWPPIYQEFLDQVLLTGAKVVWAE